MTFPGHGVWSYLGAAGWSLLNPRDATRLAAGDLDANGAADLVIDFGASVGVWVLQNGTTWWQLHTFTSEGITIGDLDGNGHDEVIIDFGGVGVWSFEDLGGWQQVHTFNPKTIVTGRLFWSCRGQSSGFRPAPEATEGFGLKVDHTRTARRRSRSRIHAHCLLGHPSVFPSTFARRSRAQGWSCGEWPYGATVILLTLVS